ncbi:MAG: hypothetical protein GY803_22565 [Chloroflexi bacterium]|nr:hypothetical protein [Chloroflexota bacterium]
MFPGVELGALAGQKTVHFLAFANKEGGQVFVGVDDSGEISGIDDPQGTEERIINTSRNNCIPPLDVLVERVAANGNLVLVVHVPQRTGRPYENRRGQCFIRVGSTKRQASADERVRLLEAAGLFHFEETPVARTTVADLDQNAFADYYRRIYDTSRLPQIIEASQAFILRNTRLSTTIVEAKQEDFYQYPRPAIREAIVNAVAHRDYSISGSPIRIFIFDDRLEIYSPGQLPNSVTLDNIRTHFSRPRNEIIARVLLNLGYVNILESGIPRMIRLARQHSGKEPDLEVRDNLFFVRLWSRTDVVGEEE